MEKVKAGCHYFGSSDSCLDDVLGPLLDPVSGQETPIDREDVIDDLDIRDDSEEENGHSQR